MRSILKLIIILTFFSALLCCRTVNASKTIRALSPKAISALDSSKKNVRIAGIASLGKSNNPKARPYLEKMLDDSEATVRASAVDALGKIGDPRALRHIYILQNDPSNLVRKFVRKSIKSLEKLQKNSEIEIQFYFSQVKDLSGRVPDKLKTKMQTQISNLVSSSAAFKSQINLLGSSNFSMNKKESGYLIHLKTSQVKKKRQGEVRIITVKCEVMILTYPDKSLRLQASATAGAGIEGKLSPQMRDELLGDGINQCSKSLAEDIIAFSKERQDKHGRL